MFEALFSPSTAAPKHGNLRVVYIHQVGATEPVTCPATDIIDAYNKVQLISNLMLTLVEQNAIPDYSNALFVEVYEQGANSPDEGNWVAWEDTEVGAEYLDLESLVEQHTNNGWFLASDYPFKLATDSKYLIMDKSGKVAVVDNTNGGMVYNNEAVNTEELIAWADFKDPTEGLDLEDVPTLN